MAPFFYVRYAWRSRIIIYYYIVRTRPIGARPIEARPDPTRPEQLGIKKRPDYGALSLGVITL